MSDFTFEELMFIKTIVTRQADVMRASQSLLDTEIAYKVADMLESLAAKLNQLAKDDEFKRQITKLEN